MRSERKRKIITLSILAASILVISVGFAAFSGSLIIKSKATISPDESLFDVKLSTTNSVPATTGSVAPTLYPSTETTNLSSNIVANNITIDGSTTISGLSAAFVSPGDKVTYKLYAVNEGGYDVYLDSINFIGNKTCTALEDTQDSLVQEACNGISVTITVRETLYTTTATQISGHKLIKKTGEEILITLKYDSNASRADGPFTVNFGKISLVYSTATGTNLAFARCKLTNDVDGNSEVSNSDEVTCGTESFYVIPNDSTAHPTATGDNITLITKYNLDVGSIYDGTNLTPISNPTGIQNPEAIGEKSSGYPYYGVIAFSETNYWGSVSQYAFIYNNQSLLYPHVENYKTYMKNIVGVDVKEASLASYTQYDSFKSYTNFNFTSFWLGSSASVDDDDRVSYVSSDGNYGYNYYSHGYSYGVRPIIVISRSDIGVS